MKLLQAIFGWRQTASADAVPAAPAAATAVPAAAASAGGVHAVPASASALAGHDVPRRPADPARSAPPTAAADMPGAGGISGAAAEPAAASTFEGARPVVPASTPAGQVIEVPAFASRRRDAVEPADDFGRFFAEPYFSQGWQDGRLHRSRQALELGRREIIARYRNTLVQMIENCQRQVDQLADSRLQTEGVSEMTSRRLALVIARQEREMQALREEMAQALEGRGRVAEPLARYENGFTKGLNDALAAELLGLVERPR